MIFCRAIKEELPNTLEEEDIIDDDSSSDDDDKEFTFDKTWFILCGDEDIIKKTKSTLTVEFFKIANEWSDDEMPTFEAGQDIPVDYVNIHDYTS